MARSRWWRVAFAVLVVWGALCVYGACVPIRFAAGQVYEPTCQPVCMATAELNGDGRADLILPMRNGEVEIVLATSSGTLYLSQTLKPNAINPWLDFSYHNYQHVALADFNGDGVPDLCVMGSGRSQGREPTSARPLRKDVIYMIPGTGLPPVAAKSRKEDAAAPARCCFSTEAPITTAVPEGHDLVAIQAGDFNGDGKQDLLVTLNPPQRHVISYRVVVLHGRGDGTFQPPVEVMAGASGVPCVADFNGDGLPDIGCMCAGDYAMLHHEDYPIAILLGRAEKDGGRSFVLQRSMLQCAIDKRMLVACDLNGDGKTDILPATDNITSLFEGRGNGSFLAHGMAPRMDGGFLFCVADFNHDGKLDILTGSNGNKFWSGNIEIYCGFGDFSFRPVGPYVSGAALITASPPPDKAHFRTWIVPKNVPEEAVAGDFDGDGRIDFAYRSCITSEIRVMKNVTGDWWRPACR